MEIRLPQTINDCRPTELAKWVLLSGGGIDLDTATKKLDFRVQVVSIFSGVDKVRLYESSVDTINSAFSHVIEMLSQHVPDDPKGVQIVNGTIYRFDTDFNNMSSGQVVDIKLIEDVYSNPCEVLAALYIEDGMKYNQTDEHGKVINDSDFRRKTFECDFDGAEFLNVFAFFLNNYEKRKDAILALSMARTQATMDQMKKELMEKSETRNGTTGQR